MAKKDIYRFDQLTQVLGAVLAGLSLLAFFAMPIVNFPIVRTVFLLGGGVMFFFGTKYYQRERKILRVWNALDELGEIKVTSLMATVGLPRDFIMQSLHLINAQANVYYVYEPETDAIVDGKLLSTFLVTANCQNCGRSFARKVSLSFAELPTCTHCSTPVAATEVNQRKEQVLAEREKRLLTRRGPKLKVGLLIVLAIFFWPAAVIYFLWYQNQRAEVRDPNEPQDVFLGLK